MELLDWALEVLPELQLTSSQKSQVCVSLGKVRVGYDGEGARREQLTLTLLDLFGDSSDEAQRARLHWLAARAGRLVGDAKQVYLERLLLATKAGRMTQLAAQLVATCGDMTLVVKGEDRTMTVQACRLALAESSEYFRKLLSGEFRESFAVSVTIDTQFAEVFCNVVLPYLYRGGRLDGPLKDYDVAVQVLAISTQFEFASLRRTAMDMILVGINAGLLEMDGDTASFLWLLTQGLRPFQKAVIDGWCHSLRGVLEEGREEQLAELLGTNELDLALEDGSYTTSLDSVLSHPRHSR
jgi:hypothetical protein